MSLREQLLGSAVVRTLRNIGVLAGLRGGIALSVVLVTWLLLANRVPFLERFAWERNLAAAVALVLLALVPLVRYLRAPWLLLVSGITAWAIFSLSYRGCFLFFPGLAQRIGTFHLFMLGSVLYTIAATLAWIGSFVWKVRDHHASQTRHHLS